MICARGERTGGGTFPRRQLTMKRIFSDVFGGTYKLYHNIIMVIRLERVAISSIKHKTLHQLSTYIQYHRDMLCMFNFTFMPDVGMGYVSLDPYTLFGLMLFGMAFPTSFYNL